MSIGQTWFIDRTTINVTPLPLFLTGELSINNGLRIGRSLVKLYGLVKSAIKVATEYLRTTKVAIFALRDYKGLLVKYEKYGNQSINDS